MYHWAIYGGGSCMTEQPSSNSSGCSTSCVCTDATCPIPASLGCYGEHYSVSWRQRCFKGMHSHPNEVTLRCVTISLNEEVETLTAIWNLENPRAASFVLFFYLFFHEGFFSFQLQETAFSEKLQAQRSCDLDPGKADRSGKAWWDIPKRERERVCVGAGNARGSWAACL